MSIPVNNPPWKLPPYCYKGGPVPEEGPDHQRFVFAYNEARQEGLTHEAARERARGQLNLLHVLLTSLGAAKTKRNLGSHAMGVPIDQIGVLTPIAQRPEGTLPGFAAP